MVETTQSQLTELESIRNIHLESMGYLKDISKYTNVLFDMAEDIISIKKNAADL